MQQKRTTLISLFGPDSIDHFVGAMLETISAWLDDHSELLDAVAEESVPATGKIVSMFEQHTAIVRKGGRETAYGHKINLATSRSGLVLDVVVETGNPADSARCLPMLERHCEHYGKAPTRLRISLEEKPGTGQGVGREGRHLLPQALLWTGALPLARPVSLPGMGTFGGLNAQPGATGATAPHLIGGKVGKRTKPVRAMTPEGLPWL